MRTQSAPAEFQPIANRIRNARKALGMRQGDLASAAGVTQQSVSQWERALGVPDAANVKRLSDLLQIPVAELLPGDDSPAASSERFTAAQLAVLSAYVELPEEIKPHIRTLIQSLAVMFRKSYHEYLELQQENNRLRDDAEVKTRT